LICSKQKKDDVDFCLESHPNQFKINDELFGMRISHSNHWKKEVSTLPKSWLRYKPNLTSSVVITNKLTCNCVTVKYVSFL
jgi:hypothetical protein